MIWKRGVGMNACELIFKYIARSVNLTLDAGNAVTADDGDGSGTGVAGSAGGGASDSSKSGNGKLGDATTRAALTTIIDPFCGHGSFLAMASRYGFDSIGVERTKKRAKAAAHALFP